MPRAKANTKSAKVSNGSSVKPNNVEIGDDIVSSTTNGAEETDSLPTTSTKGRGRAKKPIELKDTTTPNVEVEVETDKATKKVNVGRSRRKSVKPDEMVSEPIEEIKDIKPATKARGKKSAPEQADVKEENDEAVGKGKGRTKKSNKPNKNEAKKEQANADQEVSKPGPRESRKRKEPTPAPEVIETEAIVDKPDSKSIAKKRTNDKKSKKSEEKPDKKQSSSKKNKMEKKDDVEAEEETENEPDTANLKLFTVKSEEKPDKKQSSSKKIKMEKKVNVEAEEGTENEPDTANLKLVTVKSEPKIEKLPKETKKTNKNVENGNVVETAVATSKKRKGKKIVAEQDIEELKDTTTVVESGETANKKLRGRKRAAAIVEESDEVKDETEVDVKPEKTKRTKTAAKKPTGELINATDTTYNKSEFELAPNDKGNETNRYNLKISSWNVAGLRSWLKKDGLKYLDYEEPDIFCMQEIKCTVDQLPEEAARISGYHPYWLCMPGGYAGVAIYSKIMPINVEYGIGNPDFDDVGRIITAEYEKFFLINVYVPNSGRKLVNLEARMRWEKLFQAYIQKLDACKAVVICGDMNVSHQEIDLANPKANTRNAGFTKEERDKMTELLKLGYVDTFRHLYPERTGAYTYWTYMSNSRARNVGWRLDYFITSQRFVKRVVDNCIRTQVKGSDHCPITLYLKL